MSRGEKIQKWLQKNRTQIFLMILWLVLMIDCFQATGDLRKILFGHTVIVLAIQWLYEEFQKLKKEILNLFQSRIDRAVIDALNLRERERKLNK